MARERIAKGVGAGFCNPFGGPTDDELLLAKLEQWAGEGHMEKSARCACAVGDLRKRASGFSAGDLVHERQPCVTGECRTGRVTKVGGSGILTIAFDGGVECMCTSDCVEMSKA